MEKKNYSKKIIILLVFAFSVFALCLFGIKTIANANTNNFTNDNNTLNIAAGVDAIDTSSKDAEEVEITINVNNPEIAQMFDPSLKPFTEKKFKYPKGTTWSQNGFTKNLLDIVTPDHKLSQFSAQPQKGKKAVFIGWKSSLVASSINSIIVDGEVVTACFYDASTTVQSPISSISETKDPNISRSSLYYSVLKYDETDRKELFSTEGINSYSETLYCLKNEDKSYATLQLIDENGSKSVKMSYTDSETNHQIGVYFKSFFNNEFSIDGASVNFGSEEHTIGYEPLKVGLENSNLNFTITIKHEDYSKILLFGTVEDALMVRPINYGNVALFDIDTNYIINKAQIDPKTRMFFMNLDRSVLQQNLYLFSMVPKYEAKEFIITDDLSKWAGFRIQGFDIVPAPTFDMQIKDGILKYNVTENKDGKKINYETFDGCFNSSIEGSTYIFNDDHFSIFDASTQNADTTIDVYPVIDTENGYTFKNWNLNGVDVKSGDTGTLKIDHFEIYPVLDHPTDADKGQSGALAQTSDNLTFLVFVLITAFAASCIYIAKRYRLYIRKNK